MYFYIFFLFICILKKYKQHYSNYSTKQALRYYKYLKKKEGKNVFTPSEFSTTCQDTTITFILTNLLHKLFTTVKSIY